VRNTSRMGIPIGDDELRQITLYAATCARRVLPVFGATHPNDPRPRRAVAEAEAFAAGKRRTAILRTTAWAAYAAARELKGAPAAHAASHAAASAYLHPIASPHQVKHVLGAAVHQALAFEREAGNDMGVGGAHLSWAATLAPQAVRDILRRLPPPPRGPGRFSELLNELDAGLRG
jgi:hypothetical protein